jgi:hypothetical protein
MDPLVARALALSILLPAFIATAALLGAWWSRRRDGHEPLRPPDPRDPALSTRAEPLWAMPLVTGLLVVLMHPLVVGKVAYLDRGAENAVWLAGVLGAILGVTARLLRLPPIARWAVRALLVAALGLAIAWSFVQNRWGVPEAGAWLAAFTALTCLAWWGAERLADRARGWGVPALLWLLAFGAFNLIALAYSSLKIAQLAGVVAAVAGAAMVVGALRPRFTLAFGGVHAPVLVVMSALFAAMLGGGAVSNTEGLPRLYGPVFALAFLTPLLADVLVDRGPLARVGARAPWQRSLLRLALGAIPVIAALGLWAVAQGPLSGDAPASADEEYQY